MSSNQPTCETSNFGAVIEQVAASIQALPRQANLTEVLKDVAQAGERGYYLPDEDERLRVVYSDYLRVRSILLEAISELRPEVECASTWQRQLKAFSIGYTAACMLVRAATYIIEMAQTEKVIWKKLDEAEPRFHIERKSLTELYRNLTAPATMWRFYEASRFYECHRQEIYALTDPHPSYAELLAQLHLEEPFIEARKRLFLKRRLKYRLYDFLRRNRSGYKKAMFHLFRLSGSAIAEMRDPFSPKSPQKQVNARVIAEIRQRLRPGDVIITRHSDALSNLFLPGFWPHAALYVGSAAQRDALGGCPPLPEWCHTIEAKKDGVKLRRLEETLNVDFFLILRSRLAGEHLSQLIRRAATHAGKRYDFLFDFTQADRLACTELVYRSYHGIDGIHFDLHLHSGRMCLSAEDLINQAICSGDFEAFAVFGIAGEIVQYGADAHRLLRESFHAAF